MTREDALQERLARLEAGESIESCLAGLPEEEADLLRMAAAFRSVAFPERSEHSVTAQRAALMRAAAARSGNGTASLSTSRAALASQLGSILNALRALPRPASLALAGAALVLLLGVVLIARQPAPTLPGVATGPAYRVHVPIVSSARAAPDPRSALVGDARGLVEAQLGGDAWTAVDAGSVLAAGQRIRTGALSGATLLFYDGSRATLGPQTEISIEELNAQVDGPRVVRLAQHAGDADHDVNPSNLAASSYVVDTPSGSGAAKGTSFSVRVRPNQLARFNVDEGAVEVTSLNVTVVVGAGQSSTVYAGAAPSQPVFRISGEGTLTQKGDAWTIGGRDFLVNTSPGEGRSVTEIMGNPQIGDWVSVDGRILPDGTYFADRIVLLRRAPENRFSFSGMVDSIGVDEWTISGRAVRVNDATEIDADIEAGDRVEVSGAIVEGGALLAERIRRLDETGLPFEFTGIVESIGSDTWTISGIAIAVDANTEIKDSPAVGDVVKVEGHILADGTWLAEEIKPAEEDERRFELTGTVEQIDPWVVSGVHFDTSDATEIDDGIAVGDRVKVEGRVLDDGVWLAEEIRLLDDELRSFNFTGRVRQIDPWIIGGLDIAVDEQTVIDAGIEVGDMVRVRGVILPDGTLLARSIRLVDDEPGCMDIVTVIIRIDGNRIVLADGQTIELNDQIEVIGDLQASAVVIIRVCIQADGSVVIVSITIIVRPQPPAPPPSQDCVAHAVIRNGEITLPNGTSIRLSDGTVLELRMKRKGDEVEIRVNGRDPKIKIKVHTKGRNRGVEVKLEGKGRERITAIGLGRYGLAGTLIVQACVTDRGLVIIVSGPTLPPTPTPPPPPPPDTDGPVTLCHIPPGNPSAAHTIQVDPPAVPAHLAHGDYLGPCRDDGGGDDNDDDDDDDGGGGSGSGAYVITENNQTLTLTCNGHSVIIRGNNNTITLLGRCSSITNTGNNNIIQ